MQTELNYSNSTVGLIDSAFFIGYITTQVIAGHIADKFGGKIVLTIAALLWSLFTLVTPFAAYSSISLLIICRIGLGAGEGCAFPAIHAIVAKISPVKERSTAIAVITAFSYAGAIVANIIGGPIVDDDNHTHFFGGWPKLFYLFGVFGSLWIIPWCIWGSSQLNDARGINQEDIKQYSNERYNDHDSNISIDGLDENVNNEEQCALYQTSEIDYVKTESDDIIPKDNISPIDSVVTSPIHSKFPSQIEVHNNCDKHRSTPWKPILQHREIWAIITNQFCSAWGFYVFLNWLPKYYQDTLNVNITQIGFFASKIFQRYIHII